MGKFFESMPFGVKPFWSITPAKALANLRSMLDRLQVADAMGYRTHDLRRGHADDIVKQGGRLSELLQLGEWGQKSTAYQSYLDMMQLETEAVVSAHAADDVSTDEEEAAVGSQE